jgi:hypothetical protein
MTISQWFWIIDVICIIFCVAFGGWTISRDPKRGGAWGVIFVILVLVNLLGWHGFGNAVK